jgi:hypothetical protein
MFTAPVLPGKVGNALRHENKDQGLMVRTPWKSPHASDYGIHRRGFQEYLCRGYTTGDTCHGRNERLSTRGAKDVAQGRSE